MENLSKKKKVTFTLITIFLGILLSLLITELALTIKHKLRTRFWTHFIPDKNLGWHPKHSADFEAKWYKATVQKIHTNSLGLRDSLEPKEVGYKKVVFIQGDSNIFGFGMEDNQVVSYHLQELLGKGKYAVINGGCSGYDLQNYVKQFKELSKKYKIIYNIIFFNLINDAATSLMRTAYRIQRPFYDLNDGELKFYYSSVRTNGQYYGFEFVPSLKQYNRLVQANQDPALFRHNFLTRYSHLIFNIYRKQLPESCYPDPIFTQEEKDMAVLLNPNAGGWLYMEEWPEAYRSGKQLLVRLFKEYTKYPQTKTIVIFIPMRDQILVPWEEAKRNLVKTIAATGKYDDVEIERLAINIHMAGIVRKAGLSVCDPTTGFDVHPEREHLYLEGDDHFSAKGHRLLADFALKALGGGK